MTKEEARAIAEKAVDWATGSWGQSKYDSPKYSTESMRLIWAEIRNIASVKFIEADKRLDYEREQAK